MYLAGNKFSLKIKGSVYKSCVRSAMPYGSKTWCLRQKSHDEKYVWSENNGQEVDKRSNADVGIQLNNRSAGKN